MEKFHTQFQITIALIFFISFQLNNVLILIGSDFGAMQIGLNTKYLSFILNWNDTHFHHFFDRFLNRWKINRKIMKIRLKSFIIFQFSNSFSKLLQWNSISDYKICHEIKRIWQALFEFKKHCLLNKFWKDFWLKSI